MTRVAVIGPGRVGTALAIALPRPAYEVVAVSGRSGAVGTAGPAGPGGPAGPAMERFTALVPEARVRSARDACRAADLVLVCVPDDALEDVVRDIAEAGGVVAGSRWVHTAGGAGLAPLRPAALAGAGAAACHPAQTFPDPLAGAAALPGTSWAVTAAEADLGWSRVLVTDLRGSPVTVPDGSRPLYHAGVTVGSNATSAVVALARELLVGAGVEDPASLLAPLATASAANAARRGAAALTGPVRRGDVGTVAAHVGELERVLPEAVEAYLALARITLTQARRAGLDEAAAGLLEDLLGSGPVSYTHLTLPTIYSV